MNPRLILALVLGILFAFGGLVVLAKPEGGDSQNGPRRFEGATLPRGLEAPDFTLTDQDGERVSMRALRGGPVIVDVPLHDLPGHLPTQAQQVKAALDELGEDVPALAVAVDPAARHRLSGRARSCRSSA